MPRTAIFCSSITSTVLKRRFEVACIDELSPIFVCLCVLESETQRPIPACVGFISMSYPIAVVAVVVSIILTSTKEDTQTCTQLVDWRREFRGKKGCRSCCWLIILFNDEKASAVLDVHTYNI